MMIFFIIKEYINKLNELEFECLFINDTNVILHRIEIDNGDQYKIRKIIHEVACIKVRY